MVVQLSDQRIICCLAAAEVRGKPRGGGGKTDSSGGRSASRPARCGENRGRARQLGPGKPRDSPFCQGAEIVKSTSCALVLVCLISAFITNTAFAQERRERTLDEIKVEAVHRAENGMYPLIGLDPADVKEAFEYIHTSDKDEWAMGFMKVADRYMAEGQSLEKTDPVKANADYIRAWRVYSFGRWPIPISPKKQEPYHKAIQAFLSRAHFWDPPLEVVHIPFEGKEIIGYMRLPKNAKGPVPIVIAVNGLDSRKEDLTESFSAILPYGVGFIAVDGPGTGQAPIKVSETSERMLSRVIDYLQTRPEVDKNKIVLHGVSWGAYWATKMAIVERARLRGTSAQSPPIDTFFQESFLRNSL